MSARTAITWLQAVFYGVTGLWPIFSRRTFEAVTGPKTDFWLVKTVGALITVVAGVLGMAAYRQSDAPEVPILAMGSAASLAAADVVFVSRGRISRVYLLDALAEAGLIALWAVALYSEKKK